MGEAKKKDFLFSKDVLFVKVILIASINRGEGNGQTFLNMKLNIPFIHKLFPNVMCVHSISIS